MNQQNMQQSARNFNIEKEVAAALESVIPRAALGPFVSLNTSEKVTQLVELSNLVIGIRLFNKEIGKGGASLASLQELIGHQGRELTDMLRREAIETVEKCDDYAAYFSMSHDSQMKQTHPQKQTPALQQRYKNELTFYRQYLSYVLSLQDDIEVSENIVETNEARYTKEKSELQKLLKDKSSAPKEQVYPKFATLAQAYIALLDEKRLCESRQQLYHILIEARQKMVPMLLQDLVLKAKQLQQLKDVQDPSQAEPLEHLDIDPTLCKIINVFLIRFIINK